MLLQKGDIRLAVASKGLLLRGEGSLAQVPKALNSRIRRISQRKPGAGPSLGTCGPVPGRVPLPPPSPAPGPHTPRLWGRPTASNRSRRAPGSVRMAPTRGDCAPLPPPPLRKASEDGEDPPAPGSARRALLRSWGADEPHLSRTCRT